MSKSLRAAALTLWGGVCTISAAGAAPLCPLVDLDTHPLRRPLAVGSVASSAPPLRVHYCHATLRPLAERVLRAAVRSYRVEVDELGFVPPLSDQARGGGAELDLYLANLGRGGRAQANDEPQSERDVRAPGYVVLDYRTPEENDFLASYVSHEMHHVLQYALGRQVGAPFMEATAAYVDDRLYPKADVLTAMAADFQRQPHRPIYFQEDRSSYDYGAALFVRFLVRRHDIGLIRGVFARGQVDYVAALDVLLRGRGTDLATALREFSRYRVRTGRYHRPEFFPDGARFPEVAVDRSLSPFEFIERPLEVRLLHPPQDLGAAYVSLDVTTSLSAGVVVEVHADDRPGLLAVDLLSSDRAAPLDGALLRGGGRILLRAGRPRPGARLWLAVTNLGQGPPRVRSGDLSATAHGVTATFRVLPEP